MACVALGHVAAVNQQVAIGLQSITPGLQPGAVLCQRVGLQHAAAQHQRAHVTVGHQVDGTQLVVLRQPASDLLDPVAFDVQQHHLGGRGRLAFEARALRQGLLHELLVLGHAGVHEDDLVDGLLRGGGAHAGLGHLRGGGAGQRRPVGLRRQGLVQHGFVLLRVGGQDEALGRQQVAGLQAFDDQGAACAGGGLAAATHHRHAQPAVQLLRGVQSNRAGGAMGTFVTSCVGHVRPLVRCRSCRYQRSSSRASSCRSLRLRVPTACLSLRRLFR